MVTLAPVDAPAPERPLINLLGAARTPGGAGRWQEGTTYDSESCARIWTADTCEPALNSEVRAGVGPDNPEGRRVSGVAVYALAEFDCMALPNTVDGYRDRALRALDAELPRAVEHELWTGAIAQASALPTRYLTDGATDLAAAAVSPARALGLLERALADVYSGIGLIHCTREALPYLPHVTRSGRVLETRVGNRVVPGVGYPGTGSSIGVVTGVDAGGLVDGGTLPDDAGYEYVVTALTDTGETLPSAEVSALVNGGGGTASVVVTWSPLDGATGYRVYGRQSGSLALLGEVPAGTETFTDTGDGPDDPEAVPPTTDTSGTAAEGEAWLYITPMVTVRIGDPELPDRASVDPGTNRAHATARAPFEVTWDGCSNALAVRMVMA